MTKYNPCIGHSKFSAGISDIWCAVYFTGDQQLFVHLADPRGAEIHYGAPGFVGQNLIV